MLVNSLVEEEAFDGADDEEDGDGGKDEYDNEDEEDDEDDGYKNVEMGRLPAHAAARCGRGHAAPPARHSPQRPAAPAAAEVDCLAANFARAGLDFPLFNFQARYPHVLIPTPALASGRRTVVGYWLTPTVDQARFSVEVSANGMHFVFNMHIPRQFADLNARVSLEVDQVLDIDAAAIAAGFCQIQDQIVHLFTDLTNIRPDGQRYSLPFACEQNPMLIQVLFTGDDLLQSQLQAENDFNHQYLSIVRVVFQAREMLCHRINYGRPQVIRSPGHQHQQHFQHHVQPLPPLQHPPQQQQQVHFVHPPLPL